MDDEKDDYWNTTQNVLNIFDDDKSEFGFSKLSHNKASNLAKAVRSNIDWESEQSGDKDSVGLIGWDGSAKYSTGKETDYQQQHLHHSVREIRGGASSSTSLSDNVTTPEAGAANRGDVDKLRHDIAMLTRQLQGRKAINVVDTVRAMLIGKPYHLEQYKSAAEKYKLLDEAIASHDGNVITAVVLYVRRTLKASLFTESVRRRPQALAHYLHYLKLHHDYNDYTDMLRMCGRNGEAALFDYQRAISVSDPASRINRLKACHSSQFQYSPELMLETRLIQEHIQLLELQQPVEREDARVEALGQSPLFKKYPRSASVVDMPTLTTLYYCCFYHYEQKEATGTFYSPTFIKQTFSLNDKQYVWTAGSALARLSHWHAFEQLFITKGMFGRRVMRSPIGFVNVVNILSKNNAPIEVMSPYLRLIDNADTRLTLAKASNCYDVIVECLMTARDRQQLRAYRASLTPHTKPWQCADDAERNSAVKWKN